jgi:hypothetical protein
LDPFYDTRDSVLAITGGTGAYANARGKMKANSMPPARDFSSIEPHLIG